MNFPGLQVTDSSHLDFLLGYIFQRLTPGWGLPFHKVMKCRILECHHSVGCFNRKLAAKHTFDTQRWYPKFKRSKQSLWIMRKLTGHTIGFGANSNNHKRIKMEEIVEEVVTPEDLQVCMCKINAWKWYSLSFRIIDIPGFMNGDFW